MTDLRAGRETARGLPAYPADVPVPRRAVEPPPSLGEGVALTRVLAMVRLTPAQAVELGSGVLTAVAAGTDRAVGRPAGEDRVTIDEVTVGADGRVALRPAGDRRSDR